jgi:NDP-sugar pyrophosphorylase family protein
MKAMIFAAGLGTRLKPLTDTMPKALVPVCGQPLLYHVITKLVVAGYDDLVVNVHHFPDQIIHYLHSHDFGARISVSDERDFLRETGGGVRFAQHLLTDFSTSPSASLEMTKRDSFAPLGMTEEPFLVHNVDIVSNLDLGWLREQHREGALATVVVSERKTQRYLLFDEEGRLKGWTNVATGEVRSPFPDIDLDRCRKLAFAGIHLMSPVIFDAFEKLGMGERFSIIDFYLKACAKYPIYAAVPSDFTLVDVGKFATLPEAEATCAAILNV